MGLDGAKETLVDDETPSHYQEALPLKLGQFVTAKQDKVLSVRSLKRYSSATALELGNFVLAS